MSNEKAPVTQLGIQPETAPVTQFSVTEVPVTQFGIMEDVTALANKLEQGNIFADGYVIEKLLSDSGAQADVYLAQKERKKYVIKKYRNGYKPKEDVLNRILQIKHPAVVELIDARVEQGGYYEIYKYYEKGTLEEHKRISKSIIEKNIIPDINEGLHVLHKEGIIHGDLKPSNLFLSDDEEHVLIGDFGISVYTDGNSMASVQVAGTPEYSPRTKGILNQESKSFAYDYGSFGLILIRLITGRSIFAGLDAQAINEKWAKGINLPDEISGRLERLIKGLIVDDEEKRFGYKDVKEWEEGQFVQIKHRSLVHTDEKKNALKPLIFGFFNDEVLAVKNLEQLKNAIVEHWEYATGLLKRREFRAFLKQYSEAALKLLDEEIDITDEDSLLFKICCEINEEKTIIYKGSDLGTLNDFYSVDTEESRSIKTELIAKGLLQYYMQRMDYANDVIDIVRDASVKGGMHVEFVLSALKKIFEGESDFTFKGEKFSSLIEFTEYIGNCEEDDLMDCVEDKDLLSWIYSLCSDSGKNKLMKILE